MSGCFRCECCGADFMGDEDMDACLCDDCQEADCSPNREGAYDDCQRTDMDEESEFYSSDEYDGEEPAFEDSDYEPVSFGDGEP